MQVAELRSRVGRVGIGEHQVWRVAYYFAQSTMPTLICQGNRLHGYMDSRLYVHATDSYSYLISLLKAADEVCSQDRDQISTCFTHGLPM